MSQTMGEMLAGLTARQQMIHQLMLEECGHSDGAETSADGSADNDLAHERAAAAMWMLLAMAKHSMPEDLLPAGGKVPGQRVTILGLHPGVVMVEECVNVKVDAINDPMINPARFPAWAVKEAE